MPCPMMMWMDMAHHHLQTIWNDVVDHETFVQCTQVFEMMKVDNIQPLEVLGMMMVLEGIVVELGMVPGMEKLISMIIRISRIPTMMPNKCNHTKFQTLCI